MGNVPARLIVVSELTEIEKIRSFLRENLKELKISEKEHYQIELSLLEVCINIIRYAYPQQKGEIMLKTWREKGKIFLEIRDNGIPFDPTKSKPPDLKEILSNEEKGGLGIFLTRKLMDGLDYKRENNQNILTMHKNIEEAARPDSI